MQLSTILPVSAWLWEKYGKTITDRTAEAVRSRWQRFRWNEAAERYRAKIIKLYGAMQIMGMSEPVSLENIFTDLYMLDKPSAFFRFDIERLKHLSGDPVEPPQGKRVNGLRLVVKKYKRYYGRQEGAREASPSPQLAAFENEKALAEEKDNNLFILGKPGAGKTTFLKYIAVKAAEQTVDKVPIFLSLREWADSGKELMAFINERFDICDFPDAQPFVEELLRSGEAIVLFDGLDEVNQEGGRRSRQVQAMNNFIEKFDGTQYLVTCRIAANDYSFVPFIYVEIADFTEQQIRTFVGNWFRNRQGEKDRVTYGAFFRAFEKEENRGLRDLARTPLLLTLLCLAFNETLTFPRRRVEIYEEALDALLKKWDSSRRIKRDDVFSKLSLGHRVNLLARIAAETFENSEYFIPQSKLENLIKDYVRNVPPHEPNEMIDGEAILKAIEEHHGILVERAYKIYSFSHLTLQEYFTAKYIVDNSAKGTLTELIKANCADTRWREVFLLTTSLLSDACQFMAMLREGVDNLIEKDDRLLEMLVWANNKSRSLQFTPWLSRLYVLFLELFYQIKSPRDLAFALAFALSLELDLVDGRAPELSMDLGPVHARRRALDRALDSGLSRPNLIRFLDRDLTRDLERARKSAIRMKMIPLAEALGGLSIPTYKATFEDWENSLMNYEPW
jgi:hypothetical protein